MALTVSGSNITFNDSSTQSSSPKPQLQSLGVSLASSALTIASQQFSTAFKTSLTSGAVVTITGSPAALTIPSGATLGTVSAVASSIIVAVLNNAGTLEYAVQNIAGGSDMSETDLINTTAISAAATANNVWYSNTARTSVPYSIIYRIDSTQATAGAWVTAPSLLQGVGGQALATMSSLGYGQRWTNVTASRSLSTTYYNTTGRSIFVIVGPAGNVSQAITVTVNGVSAYSMSGSASGIGMPAAVIVPAGASYSCTFSVGSLALWTELR